MRGSLAVLTAVLLAGTGCAQRERANPFDPNNPGTGGRPTGFVALAGNGRVSLRWEGVSSTGVVGWQIFRRRADQSAFTPLSDLLPVWHDRFDDPAATNGIEHFYRLHFVFEDGPSGPPAEDAAIPGPLMPWATDLAAHSLLALTADGRHVADFDTRYIGPTHIAIDAADSRLWIADTFDGSVVIQRGLERIPITGLVEPGSIAIDPVDHHAWICDEGRNAVYHFRPDGEFSLPPVIQPLGLPISVAVDPTDRSVWICEYGALVVRHLESDGTLIHATALGMRPSRVAVDTTTGDGWVTSFESGAVAQISPTGSIRRRIPGFAGPVGIAVDPIHDRLWVADSYGDEVRVMRRDGSEVGRVGGLRQVREITVDAATGNAWATVPGNGEIVSITPSATIRSRIQNLSHPYAIALDPGTP